MTLKEQTEICVKIDKSETPEQILAAVIEARELTLRDLRSEKRCPVRRRALMAQVTKYDEGILAIRRVIERREQLR